MRRQPHQINTHRFGYVQLKMETMFGMVYFFCMCSYYSLAVKENAIIFLLSPVAIIGDYLLFGYIIALLFINYKRIRIDKSAYSFLWFLFCAELLICGFSETRKMLHVLVYIVVIFSYYCLLPSLVSIKTLGRIPCIFCVYALLDSIRLGQLTGIPCHGIFSNSNGLGQVACFGVIGIIVIAIIDNHSLSSARTLIVVLLLGIICASCSRASLFTALAAILLSYVISSKENKPKQLKKVLVLAVITVIICFFSTQTSEWIRGLLDPVKMKITAERDSALSGRDVIWREIWNARTLFGTKEANTSMGSHSLYFGILRSYGLMGIGLFLSICFFSFAELVGNIAFYKRAKMDIEFREVCGMACLIGMILLYGFSENVSSFLNYSMMTLLVCFSKNHYYANQRRDMGNESFIYHSS